MKVWPLFLLMSLGCCQLLAQESLSTRTGVIEFNASTPLEDIQAVNEQVYVIYRPEDQRIAAQLLVREFDFPNDLMEEHFNDNYLHSQRFPKASFQGRVDLEQEEAGLAVAVGDLTIHGVTRSVRIPMQWIPGEDGGLQVSATFLLRPQEYDIRIPRIVFKKIAEEVDVALFFTLQPQP